MNDKDLGSKKINNKQNDAETSDTTISHLHSEIETMSNGEKKVVERARNTNHDEKNHELAVNKVLSTKPSTASEIIGKEMVENRDKNFDITKNRFPNSSPENQKNPKEEN